MGFRGREVETKYIIKGIGLNDVCNELDKLLRTESPVRKWGSSIDTYWTIGGDNRADFARVRERDGIRQLTVKGKDKGTNDNRIEIDLDCTSSTSDIHKWFNAAFGKSAGAVGKSYYVWEMASSEHDTVTAYVVDTDENLKHSVVMEFEARTMAGVTKLENLVLDSLRQSANITVEKAPGSLYEMCITKEK